MYERVEQMAYLSVPLKADLKAPSWVALMVFRMVGERVSRSAGVMVDSRVDLGVGC